MRALRLFLLGCLCVWQSSTALLGGEYRLTNEDVIRGQPVTFDDVGMVVRLDIGGYSPRISWSKLTQESLQELAKNPEAAKFVEPFIDTPPAPKDKDKKKEIVVRPVPRVERVEKPSFFASLLTPAGIALFLVLFLANLYAAWEIARFRYRPPALVCGLSVLLPVVAPVIFLLMPPAGAAEAEDSGLVEPSAAAQAAAGKLTTGPLAKVPMASGLSIAQGEKAGGAAAQAGPQSFKRGEFTFNRRFVETKFASFFRVVQSEKEVLVVRTAKEEFIARRVSRISSNEMHIQLLRGGNEVSVPFSDITEVQVRPNEPKG